MKILDLTLHNFKGIRFFNLNTNGQDTNIYGDNATGKTTLADAFMWLLFNKDSLNRLATKYHLSRRSVSSCLRGPGGIERAGTDGGCDGVSRRMVI